LMIWQLFLRRRHAWSSLEAFWLLTKILSSMIINSAYLEVFFVACDHSFHSQEVVINHHDHGNIVRFHSRLVAARQSFIIGFLEMA